MDRHEQLKPYLGEFAEGDLFGPLMVEVRDHVRMCPACQAWLAVYRDIGMALSGPPCEASESHPNTRDLVAFALDSSTEQSKAAWLRSHLADCPRCSEEVELCREAVGGVSSPIVGSGNPAENQKDEAGNRWPERTFKIALDQELDAVEESVGRPGRTAWHGLWAAALVLLVLGAIVYVAMQRPMPEVVVLTGETLRGTRLIEAAESVEVSQSRIDVGAKVTLRAAKVSLGNGFELNEGASLVIEARPGSQSTQNKREERR